MAELWHFLWSSFAGFTSAAFEHWPTEFPCFKGNSWMLPALPAGSNAATKHEQPPCSQDFQHQYPSPCLGAVLNHSWSRSGKRFHFQHLYPSGMHSQSFFWLSTSSGSRLLWAGLVFMLGGCRIFWTEPLGKNPRWKTLSRYSHI